MRCVRLRRVSVAALTVGLIMCLRALPVAADITYATGNGLQGTFTDVNSNNGHSFQLDGAYGGLILGNTLVEDFWCIGSATPDAGSTTLQSCSLAGVPAVSLSTYPGDIAVAEGVAIVNTATLPAGGLQLCGSGFGTFVESNLGAASLGASICTPAPTLLPQVPDVLSDVQAAKDSFDQTLSCLEFKTCVGPDLG